MRTFGYVLIGSGVVAVALWLGLGIMPFRLPLTSTDALHAAGVLLVAGALAEWSTHV